jgi:ABC-2 type transport system permease protein
MSLQRIWAMFVARNYEFFRDKAAFGWNFAFPFLIIIGFGITFGKQDFKQFKIGIFPADNQAVIFTDSTVPTALQTNKQLQFIPFGSRQDGEEKLRHHKIDLLLERNSTTHAYWINDSSPNGYLAEQIFLASFLPKDDPVTRQADYPGRTDPLCRLVLSRGHSNEHDVFRPLGRRLCCGPLSEERRPQTPEGDPSNSL